ncbi:MAG: hypothetical protein JSS72_06880 [Armatimonadetes bacterium]|nr:hypothetical protein [Armatimonadota bacterium]
MKHKRDWLGSLVGMLVFLGGIALLVFTFYRAYALFTTPPQTALGISKGSAIDLAKTGESAFGIFRDVILLVVMSLISSLIATRGIKMYAESQHSVQESARASAK